MLSEDFALAGTVRRSWNDWYKEEVENWEQYKTLYFSYKNRYFQFEPIGYKKGSPFNGVQIQEDSYIFLSFDTPEDYQAAFAKARCYSTFKEAIDQAEIVPGKTLKDIWDDPDSEYIDFI